MLSPIGFNLSMALITSAERMAMPSDRLQQILAFGFQRQAGPYPGGGRSQYGQASPESAGTKAGPRAMAGWAGKLPEFIEVVEQAYLSRPVNGGGCVINAAVRAIHRLAAGQLPAQRGQQAGLAGVDRARPGDRL